MATSGAAVREKVQRFLADILGTVEVDRDGDFTFAFESTRVFVSIIEQEDRTLVKIFAPLVLKVPPSPELYEHIALHAGDYLFGSFELDQADEGFTILFYHVLLGDYLDGEELHNAVRAIANIADDTDDELKAKFGGQRFADLGS
jgi:hypothetical protein